MIAPYVLHELVYRKGAMGVQLIHPSAGTFAHSMFALSDTIRDKRLRLPGEH